MFEITCTGLICSLGKEGSVQNGKEFEIQLTVAKFKIGDSTWHEFNMGKSKQGNSTYIEFQSKRDFELTKLEIAGLACIYLLAQDQLFLPEQVHKPLTM